MDSDDPADNPNLGLALTDAADTVAALRAGGRTVLLHCVQARTRTPVTALYAARHRGVSTRRPLADMARSICRPRGCRDQC